TLGRGGTQIWAGAPSYEGAPSRPTSTGAAVARGPGPNYSSFLLAEFTGTLGGLLDSVDEGEPQAVAFQSAHTGDSGAAGRRDLVLELARVPRLQQAGCRQQHLPGEVPRQTPIQADPHTAVGQGIGHDCSVGGA